MRISARRRQGGTTLVIGMIVLVLMTLLAVTSFNIGRGEFQIISNMQFQNEAAAAAEMALEEVVSNLNFTTSPTNVFATPCAGSNTICFDTNGDGTNDVTVTIRSRGSATGPSCVFARIIKNSDLDLSNPNQLGCVAGATQTFGVAGATTGDSLCADSVWDVQAQAVDNVTQAKATITEGMAVMVAAANIIVSCP